MTWWTDDRRLYHEQRRLDAEQQRAKERIERRRLSDERRSGMSGRALSPNEISVIRERFHGWEQATAKTLAAVFGVSVQQISAIVHSNRPDGFDRQAPIPGAQFKRKSA